MKKIKLLIPITLILVAVITFGFTLTKPNTLDSSGYYVTVTVDIAEGCAIPLGCIENVVVTVDGVLYTQPYSDGTSVYNYPIPSESASTICCYVTFDDECSGLISTVNCDTNIPRPPAILNYTVTVSCE